jgi:hypothetical protein
MALLKPLVMYSGRISQLLPADTLDAVVIEVDSITLTNGNAGAAVIGTPVYISAANTFNLARADASGTADTFALVSTASIAAAGSGTVQTDGFLTATTGQWDSVTGDTGGLTAGAAYFLSAATAGKLTTTSPTATGQFSGYVGKAISTLTLEISIDRAIAL